MPPSAETPQFEIDQPATSAPFAIAASLHMRWVYPRNMSRKPTKPAPSGRSPVRAGAAGGAGGAEGAGGAVGAGGAEGAGAEREQPRERVGPLAIARHVKGDGRALILYTRVEHR